MDFGDALAGDDVSTSFGKTVAGDGVALAAAFGPTLAVTLGDRSGFLESRKAMTATATARIPRQLQSKICWRDPVGTGVGEVPEKLGAAEDAGGGGD